MLVSDCHVASHRVEQITNAKMTLETQQLALEGVNLNVAVLSAQKAGADAMNRATKQIGGVEGVEEIVDSVEEGLQACILPLHPPLHPLLHPFLYSPLHSSRPSLRPSPRPAPRPHVAPRPCTPRTHPCTAPRAPLPQDADEIGQAVGRSINTGIDMDDDDLLAELEALEEEVGGARLSNPDPDH